MLDSTARIEPAAYASGDLIGQKYRLERELGTGAQGSVWLARNLALDARVAIKLVQREPADDAPGLRLENEARAAARLVHPAVVRVFDLGYTAAGDAFIVMEFLEGESLGDRLARHGRLPPIEAVRTLLPIADALHVAHAHGIVHRDLKPENVFLARTGQTIQPKLLDFGVAKLRNPPQSHRVVTDVGALVGSPAYLSPEQAECRQDIGREADVWSFCVVLYECVTGQLPFEAEEYSELFRRIEQEPPPTLGAHGVDEEELWGIVRRGLAKSPAERWPNMQNVGHALASWLIARGVQDDVSGVLLESKWLPKARAELASADGSDPPSFVRRIAARTSGITTGRRPRENDSQPLALRLLVAGLSTALAVVGGYVLVALPVTKQPPPVQPATTTAVEETVAPREVASPEAPATLTPAALPATAREEPSAVESPAVEPPRREPVRRARPAVRRASFDKQRSTTASPKPATSARPSELQRPRDYPELIDPY